MVQASMTVPPQPFGTVATCHGIMLGACSPPTILLPPMKEGIVAEMKEVHDNQDLDILFICDLLITYHSFQMEVEVMGMEDLGLEEQVLVQQLWLLHWDPNMRKLSRIGY